MRRGSGEQPGPQGGQQPAARAGGHADDQGVPLGSLGLLHRGLSGLPGSQYPAGVRQQGFSHCGQPHLPPVPVE